MKKNFFIFALAAFIITGGLYSCSSSDKDDPTPGPGEGDEYPYPAEIEAGAKLLKTFGGEDADKDIIAQYNDQNQLTHMEVAMTRYEFTYAESGVMTSIIEYLNKNWEWGAAFDPFVARVITFDHDTQGGTITEKQFMYEIDEYEKASSGKEPYATYVHTVDKGLITATKGNTTRYIEEVPGIPIPVPGTEYWPTLWAEDPETGEWYDTGEPDYSQDPMYEEYLPGEPESPAMTNYIETALNYEYDGNGNLTKRTGKKYSISVEEGKTYDPNATKPEVGSSSHTLTYDDKNSPTKGALPRWFFATNFANFGTTFFVFEVGYANNVTGISGSTTDYEEVMNNGSVNYTYQISYANDNYPQRIENPDPASGGLGFLYDYYNL